MINKKILTAYERPFLIAREISKWFSLNSKRGQLNISFFAKAVDNFVILNENLISGTMSASKCEKHHTYLCPDCFVMFLYSKIKVQDGKIAEDFKKKFM